MATLAPWLSIAFLVTTLASIGLPMLGNFVGEFLVLQGTALANMWWAVFASLGVILSGPATCCGCISACFTEKFRAPRSMRKITVTAPTGMKAKNPTKRRTMWGTPTASGYPTFHLREWGIVDPAGSDDGLDGRLLAVIPAARRQN